MLIIDQRKFEIAMANVGATVGSIVAKAKVATNTVTKARNGKPLTPKSVSKLAAALNVDVEKII